MVEVVVVLFIVAIVIAMVAAVTRGLAAAQKRSLTATRIAGVEAAILQFVAQQKRLPCPADGRLESSDNNAGVETGTNAAGCTGLQFGVVPWRALALSETEATDGWDRRMTYRVAPALALAGAMDMSRCDPAGTGAAGAGQSCLTTCSSAALNLCTPPTAFLAGKGLEVRNLAGQQLMNPAANPHTGAAYVLISHGESGGGGYLSSGQLGGSSIGDGTEELKNYASQAYVAGVTHYVDDSAVSVGGAGHFDDILARPSVLAVATRAGLGPRSQP